MKFIANIRFGQHPAGLAALFFTEMWERFSYYGMRALLVLYLVNGLDVPRADALHIYGLYTMLVYVTPIIGGYIADRWLGQRRAIMVGGIVMMLGHFAMAVPDSLYAGLCLLIAGNGFFKPNISTLVGKLYSADDTRRDGGFTIFYMGINLGALLAPLVCGTLGESVGWHYGFAAAGVGMALGLATFISAQQALGGSGWPPTRSAAHPDRLCREDYVVVLQACAAVVAIALVGAWLWHHPAFDTSFSTGVVGAAGIAAIGIAVWFNRRQSQSSDDTPVLTRAEKHRIIGISIMAFFVIFFWMGFEQAGGTMNLFADKLTDRNLGSIEVPTSYFQSVNPLFIILFAPLLSILWTRADRSGFALSVVQKQALGMIILGLGFIVLAVAEQRAEAMGKVNMTWLLAVYWLHTIGELCLSPIGLSMVSKMAPARFAALVMGVWFTAVAIANYLAATLEALLQQFDVPLYWFLVGSSIGAGVVLFVLAPWLHRLLRTDQ